MRDTSLLLQLDIFSFGTMLWELALHCTSIPNKKTPKKI
jgi:hypothetical protein